MIFTPIFLLTWVLAVSGYQGISCPRPKTTYEEEEITTTEVAPPEQSKQLLCDPEGFGLFDAYIKSKMSKAFWVTR